MSGNSNSKTPIKAENIAKTVFNQEITGKISSGKKLLLKAKVLSKIKLRFIEHKKKNK